MRVRAWILSACVAGTSILAGPAARAEPPANDDLVDASEISTLPFVDYLYLASATLEGDESIECALRDDIVYLTDPREIYRSVWYRFTARETATLAASTHRRFSGNALAVWRETEGGLQGVACARSGGDNDDWAPLLFHARAGTTYLFQVLTDNYPDPPSGPTAFRLEVAEIVDLAIENLSITPVMYRTQVGDVPSFISLDVEFDVVNLSDGSTGPGTAWGLYACPGPPERHGGCVLLQTGGPFFALVPRSRTHVSHRWIAYGAAGDVTICAETHTSSAVDSGENNAAKKSAYILVGNTGYGFVPGMEHDNSSCSA